MEMLEELVYSQINQYKLPNLSKLPKNKGKKKRFKKINKTLEIIEKNITFVSLESQLEKRKFLVQEKKKIKSIMTKTS